MAFELERFVEQCRAAVARGEGEKGVRELVTEAMSDRTALTQGLGEPEHAGLQTVHRSADLTVLNFAWAPWQCFKPHNHQMWSVVGLISGREDNLFWRRTPKSIEAAGARSLGAGDVTILGPDIIHSVTNPIGRFTHAIHIYGGDFFAPPEPRSEWDPETLWERPWNMEDTKRLYAEAEARWRATNPANDHR